jgi:hypothetical protein
MKRSTERTLVAGVYLACSGIFGLLALLLYPLTNGGVFYLLDIIAGTISLACIVASGCILFGGGDRKDLLSEFVIEDPARGRLDEAEFRVEFSRWKQRQDT